MDQKMEALITANEYMINLKNGIIKVVEYIQSGQEEKGMYLISDIAEGIEWIMEVVNLTINLERQSIDMSLIDEKLEEIVESIENEDYVLVGDLFYYEILPILEDIHNKIGSIISN